MTYAHMHAYPGSSVISRSSRSSITRRKRVTRRKLQTPGTVEEHKRQETPTISPNDRQPTQLTDQASGGQHYRKRSPGVKTHNTNQHGSRARLQHSTHPPSLPKPNWVIKKKIKNTHRSDITPDPGGRRPQRPCAQGRTCAKQDQAQASAPGQNRTQFVGGATTHGRRTRQAGKSVPTQKRPGAGGCTTNYGVHWLENSCLRVWSKIGVWHQVPMRMQEAGNRPTPCTLLQDSGHEALAKQPGGLGRRLVKSSCAVCCIVWGLLKTVRQTLVGERVLENVQSSTLQPSALQARLWPRLSHKHTAADLCLD